MDALKKKSCINTVISVLASNLFISLYEGKTALLLFWLTTNEFLNKRLVH